MKKWEKFFFFFRFRTADIAPSIFVFIVLLVGIGLIAFSASPSTSDPNNYTFTSHRTQDSFVTNIDTVRSISFKKNLIDSTNRETNAEYVGPPHYQEYKPKKRLPEGATIALNQVDSAMLTLVPGIGPSFARRIISLRKRLGGYYTLLQLQEVYGMTPDRYRAIKSYFTLGKEPLKIDISHIPYDSIPFHPYLSYEQKNAIQRILFRDGKLRGWAQLRSLDCFTLQDSIRLSHYFIVE